MSSWFSLNAIKDLKEKVQSAIPMDEGIIAKLTLMTPEMTAERQRFFEEEQHRAKAKNALAGMLPWETNDDERDILVEECKEAILALSQKEETFFGPYEMPEMAVKEDDDDDDDGQVKFDKNQKPSEASLQKLAKLEPLPPMLRDFDLDAHVGLIEKMLKIDPQLVEVQSFLSGGGDREKVFWRNYFFHCAFTRYEAGLSIDEIWSDQPTAAKKRQDPLTDQANEKATGAASDDAETTVTFETTEEAMKPPPNSGAVSLVSDKVEVDSVSTSNDKDSDSGFNRSSKESFSNDFELVAKNDEIAADDLTELDELEAEIARELED